MTMDDDQLEYNSILFENLYRYDDALKTCELVACNGLAIKQIHKGDFLFTGKYADALVQADEIRRQANKAKADTEASAGYDSINSYCASLGFADQWAYKFFRRKHRKNLGPYLRLSAALGYSSLEDFHHDLEAGTLDKKMAEAGFQTITDLAAAADCDRDIISDCLTRSRTDLAIYKYIDNAIS